MTLPTAEQPIKSMRCTLTLEGDEYIMRGPSGKHSLCVHHTSPERLKAHWKGFIRGK